MLSIEKCNEILNKDEKKYTKEEVLAIRESLYQLVEIIINSKENEKPKR
jgi:predicted nucleic acid-binding Zn ribbon protein